MSTIPVRLRRGSLAAIMAQAPYEPGEPVVDWTDPLSPVIYVADRDGVLRPSVVGPHGHEIADVTGLSAALLGKTDVGHGHAVADITGLDGIILGLDQHIALKADAAHDHTIANVTGLATALSGLSTDISGKADSGHGHVIGDVSGLATTLSGLSTDIAGKADSGHDHTTSQVTGLDTALAGKAAASHEHTYTDITDLSTVLAGKAEAEHSHIIDDVTGLADALAAAGTGGGGDLVSALSQPEINLTATGPLTLNRMHALSFGGTSTAMLPDATVNVGAIIGVRANLAEGYIAILDAPFSQKIDGSLTRRMWRGESAILLATPTGWTKIAGKTLPMIGRIYNSTAQQFAANTATKIATDASDFGTLHDLANQRIVIARPGQGMLSLDCVLNNTNSMQTYVELRGYTSAAWTDTVRMVNFANQYGNPYALKTKYVDTGMYFDMWLYYAVGNFGASVTIAASSILTFTEIPTW